MCVDLFDFYGRGATICIPSSKGGAKRSHRQEQGCEKRHSSILPQSAAKVKENLLRRMQRRENELGKNLTDIFPATAGIWLSTYLFKDSKPDPCLRRGREDSKIYAAAMPLST